MVREFMSEYGGMIISTVITAVLGAVGVLIKNIYKRASEDRTKKEIAKTCVLAVEQLYKNLHGEEKYKKCVEAMVEMLSEKGIVISELEIKMLIEAQVAKYNILFDQMNEVQSDIDAYLDALKNESEVNNA